MTTLHINGVESWNGPPLPALAASLQGSATMGAADTQSIPANIAAGVAHQANFLASTRSAPW
jgi:hypothetical protein